MLVSRLIHLFLGALIVANGLFITGKGESVEFDQTHAEWSKILKENLDAKKMMNYKKMKKEMDQDGVKNPFVVYTSSLEKITKVEFSKWSKSDQKAFLINAYNAFTVKLILDHYPVKSIKETGGFFTKPWDIEFFSLIGGAIKSLDPIEHKYLRPEYQDFRIHAAVNCASISCPPLRDEAFVGSRIDDQLDDQMRSWIRDDSRNLFSEKNVEVKVSLIFDWYADDFEKWGGGVKAVLLKYSDDRIKKIVTAAKDIKFLKYDWSLNEAK